MALLQSDSCFFPPSFCHGTTSTQTSILSQHVSGAYSGPVLHLIAFPHRSSIHRLSAIKLCWTSTASNNPCGVVHYHIVKNSALNGCSGASLRIGCWLSPPHRYICCVKNAARQKWIHLRYSGCIVDEKKKRRLKLWLQQRPLFTGLPFTNQDALTIIRAGGNLL